MIIEDSVFWYVEGEAGGDDPLWGLPLDYRRNIESRYGSYIDSIKTHETCMSHHHHSLDLDECLIEPLNEGKSLSHWKGAPKRKSYGNKIRSNPSYRSLLRKARNSASNQFKVLSFSFEKKLKEMISKFVKGSVTLPVLRRESSSLFQEYYEKAWLYGRRASGLFKFQKKPKKPSKEEESWFRGAVREELSFWNAFLDELASPSGGKGKIPVGNWFSLDERIEMYVQTLLFMYHSGKVSGLPDTVLLYWSPKNKPNMCPGCKYMVDNSPFPRDVMPTVPRAGDTPCLMRCVHKVVVRDATAGQIEQRRRALPSKESMLKKLRSFMGNKVRKYKGRGKGYNPWLGQTVWGLIK